jgi:hypothetical protein
MKPLLVGLCVFLIPLFLTAACSSTEENGSGTSDASSEPESIEGVTGQLVHVEWRPLNPKRPDPPLAILNLSSPEMKEWDRNPQAFQHAKPVEDIVMSALLEQMKSSGFFDVATKGPTLDSFKKREGLHGVVHLRKGNENWALVFSPGASGDVVKAYDECKKAILEVHRRTMWLTPTAPQDPDRVFRVPAGRVPTRR